MSGAAAADALHARFEQIGRSEWLRLGRKVSALDPSQRTQVEDIIAQVVHAIASHPARQLAAQEEPHVIDAALRLFEVPCDLDNLSAR